MPALNNNASTNSLNSPRNQSEGGPASPRKLTNEEMAQSVERLTRQVNRKAELGPLQPEGPKLSAEEMNASVERMYSQAITRKKAQAEIAEKRAHPDLQKHIVREQTELEGTFDKLYNSRVQHEALLQKLTKDRLKHQDEQHFCAHRKLTKEESDESAKRLHDQSMSKSQDTQQKLFAKYVTATDVKMAKRTPEEIAAAATRLSSKA